MTVGFVSGYRLMYSSDEAKITDSKITTAILQNLTPHTTYKVEVMVLTNNGKTVSLQIRCVADN